MGDFDKLVQLTKKEFPSFEIINKKNSFMCKAINVFLQIITFGQMKTFMTNFITTIGSKIYVPDGWDNNSDFSKYIVLYHERVHMKQKKKYTMPLFTFLYLLFPLPVGLAWFRLKFELEAYAAALEEMYFKLGYKYGYDEEIDAIIKHMTSSEYFWTWYSKKYVKNKLLEEIQKCVVRRGN